MPRDPKYVHALGTPLDVPPQEGEQLLRLGLLHVESSGRATAPTPKQATASKRSKSSSGSKKPATK